MKRIQLLGLVAAAALVGAAGCGDNSKSCGAGTHDVDGVCTPDNGSGGGLTCGPGTMPDTANMVCVPADGICPEGTVLAGDMCVDPASLHVDLEEGPEPNGLATGDSPAGTITLKPVGDAQGFVVHGCVKPVIDFADLDDYKLTVTGPTLVEVTDYGVVGLAAGFVALAPQADPDIGAWQRFGINVKNSTSKRQLYFPKAGTYDVVLSDARSLITLVDGSLDTLPPAGNPDGTSCYYLTLKQLTPAPTAVSLAGPSDVTFDDGGAIQFFHAAPGVLPLGFINATVSMDSSHAAPSVLAFVNGSLRAMRDAPGPGSASVLFGGIAATDDALIAFDFIYDYAVLPVDGSLTLAATDALALPTAGTTVATTTKGTTYGGDFSHLNLFYFDVASADAILGFDLTSTVALQGIMVTSDTTNVADFGTVFNGQTNTFTAFKGLVRFRDAGRYYLFVFAPRSPVGSPLSITSTVTAQTPGAVVLGSALVAQPVNAFASNVYTFDATAEPWESFSAAGTNTGNVSVALYDPATAYGRLDPLAVRTGAGAGSPDVRAGAPNALFAPASGTCAAANPNCTFSFPAAGTSTKGLILASETSHGYLVKVNPVTPTGAPTFSLTFAQRVYTDLGTLSTNTTDNGENVAANDSHRYFFKTAPGHHVTITIHPTSALEDPIGSALDEIETELAPTTGIVGTDDVIGPFVQDDSGWTAFEVRGTLGAAESYNLSIAIAP